MPKKIDLMRCSRLAHYFRDVDLMGNSPPEFIPESFPPNCLNDDDRWSAAFLLRYAVRYHHLWATFGVRDGKRTVLGSQPVVSFTDFNPADLIALREGARPQGGVVTQYALTFPLRTAVNGGIQRYEPGEHADSEDMNLDPLFAHVMEQQEMARAGAFTSCGYTSKCSDWRWSYPGNYQRCIEKIEANGFEGNTIPGLKLNLKKWSGIGVVVPDMETAREVWYDMLTLIDRRIVSPLHFNHILVCDVLAKNMEGARTDQLPEAVRRACFDWFPTLRISWLEAVVSTMDFSSRVEMREFSTRKGPVNERGGCWLWFEDNTHRYVRSLVATGRIKVSKRGRYLASLDELDPGRNLRERQEIAIEIAEELEQRFGLKSTYFCVLNSFCPDDHPAYCGCDDGGHYYITERTSST